MNTWNLNDLKAELEKRRSAGALHAYTATQTHVDRREFYLIQDPSARAALDQARQVDAETLQAQVYLRKENGRLGVASRPLLPLEPLGPQLDSLLASARLGEEEAWELPVPGAAPTGAAKAFPALRDDLAKGAARLHDDLAGAIAATGGIFNSAELFVTLERTRQLASNGHEHEDLRSKIYTEVCFSHEDPKTRDSEEFLITRWYAHPEQVDLKKMCAESQEYARASLGTEKPATGLYHVLLPAEVLGEIWNTFAGQLDSRDQYFKQPFRAPGSELIPGFAGEAFDLFVDPARDYSFASHDTDAFGVPQKRLLLASGNKVEASLTTSRFAQYLKKPVTTESGTIVIEPRASRPVAELRQAAPKVLEILQFSGLFTSKSSLTYASEIRLARLYDNETGKVSYIKGGNLSGNIPENFRGVRWAAERTLHNHQDYSGRGLAYEGPAYALVSQVAVSS